MRSGSEGKEADEGRSDPVFTGGGGGGGGKSRLRRHKHFSLTI